ncbi:MAG: protein translocase subunit SecF, partial [Gemmatimonadota bacterium]
DDHRRLRHSHFLHDLAGSQAGHVHLEHLTMIRLFANAKYDFIAYRWKAVWATVIIIVPGLILLLVRGLNYSIEFTGGTLMQIKSPAALQVADLRSGLDANGFPGTEITEYGGPTEFVIRARLHGEGVDPNDTQATASGVTTALKKVLGEGGATCSTPGASDQKWCIVRTEAVGPKVGGELRQKAFLAIFLSFFAVLAYLAYRFEWRFGLAAVIATAHDIVATIAFISVMHLEVSLVVVAAILSMVGYSLNDTIIIFDRVRENIVKMKRESFTAILNRSINETLPRSILTHGTTLSTLLALTIFGGEVIRPFSLVMFFGVFTGTFSSIYIASPVLMWIERKWPGVAVKGARNDKPAPPTRKPAPVT